MVFFGGNARIAEKPSGQERADLASAPNAAYRAWQDGAEHVTRESQ